jgi:hypothetical protein
MFAATAIVSNVWASEMAESTRESLLNVLHHYYRGLLGVLFERYFCLVFDPARRTLRNREEAEDLLQDVFVEIHRKDGKRRVTF